MKEQEKLDNFKDEDEAFLDNLINMLIRRDLNEKLKSQKLKPDFKRDEEDMINLLGFYTKEFEKN
jgi:hypothetical protein